MDFSKVGARIDDRLAKLQEDIDRKRVEIGELQQLAADLGKVRKHLTEPGDLTTTMATVEALIAAGLIIEVR